MISLGLGGCGIFSPEKGGGDPGDPPPTYEIPSRPDLALENMRRAYEAADSVQTASVYHPGYEGSSEDATNPGDSLLTFTHTDEVHHIGALRRDPNVTDIVFYMGVSGAWAREPSLDTSHPEWASITVAQGIRLEITAGSTLYTVGTNDFFEFQFAPTTPAASPTDTLWQIIRWREIKGAGG